MLVNKLPNHISKSNSIYLSTRWLTNENVPATIRNIIIDLDISPKKQVTLICRGEDDKTNILVDNKHHLEQLINVNNIECGRNIEKPSQSATAVVNNL